MRPSGTGAEDQLCESCGQRNPAGTQFCTSCHAYLAWELGSTKPAPEQHDHPTQIRPLLPRDLTPATGEPSEETAPRQGPRGSGTSAVRPAAAGQPDNRHPETGRTDTTRGRFRVVDPPNAVTVPVTGEPATLAIAVTNTSALVDGYVVEAMDPPAWLGLESTQVRLLPGTDEAVPLRLRVTSTTLVPAQQLTLALRVRSLSQAPAYAELPVTVTVPVLDAPVELRPEPRLLRVRDRDTAECALVVDNTGSNAPAQVRLTGTDPELAVQFRFDPPVLEIGPSAAGTVRLVVTAPQPEPGQESVRPLTVTASGGGREVETGLTWYQSTSVRVEDPPVAVTVEPSVVRVRDDTLAAAQVTLDNRGGREWAHLTMGASDPEGLVRVNWSQRVVHVAPGQTAAVLAWMEAPLPEVGAELSRKVTVSATGGRGTSTATATFVQSRSASPMTTLGLRLDPAVTRVRDADTAVVQVVLDNRRGRSAARVSLDGSDPERAVRFSFAAPVVTVEAGQLQTVALRLDRRRPEPGQEETSQLTVTATDGDRTVEGSGSLVQTSSRAAMELLAVHLDPSVLRLANRGSGSLSALVDNRNGTQPVRVALHGDDPENVVRFTITPTVVEVPPGGLARTTVTVRAPRPAAGREVTRPFSVQATDGRAVTQAEGTLVQTSAERRPLARILLTLLGGLGMLLGAFGQWDASSGRRGVDLDADALAGAFGYQVDVGDVLPLLVVEQLASLGLLVVGFGVLVVFGLTAPSGGLSRVAAFFGLLVLITPFVVFTLAGFGPTLGPGAVLVALGCVTGYIGGALGRR